MEDRYVSDPKGRTCKRHDGEPFIITAGDGLGGAFCPRCAEEQDARAVEAEKRARRERCIHGKRIPHVHAGGTCLFSPWLTRPVHCPKCAAEGRPAIPAKPCKHMRAAVKVAQEQGEQLCKRGCGRPVANKKDFYDYWREGVCEKCGCDDLIDRDARAAKAKGWLGPAALEAAILDVMERARWDQDTLDAVLRALELPFAARRLRLRVQPLYERTIAPTGRRGRAKRATKANSPRKVTRS